MVGMQDGTVTLEDSLSVSNKTKHTLTLSSNNNLIIMLLAVYPNELNTFLTKTYIWIFTAALYIIAKTWK